MKKLLVLVVLSLFVSAKGHCQFLNKMKDKVKNQVDRRVDNRENKAVDKGLDKTENGIDNSVKSATSKSGGSPSSSSTPSGGKFTDPSRFGSVVKKYSAKEMTDHMGGSDGGFAFSFQSVKVSGDQLQLEVAEYTDILYSYNGSGQLQNTGRKPASDPWYKRYNGSEQDLLSTDFSAQDQQFAMIGGGPHIQEKPVPGKVGQDYTFKGKKMGTFSMGFLGHNADSTVVVVNAAIFGNGKVTYSIISSDGQHANLPSITMTAPIISPDGKTSAALIQTKNGSDVIYSNGKKISIGIYYQNLVWVRNAGNVFNVDATNKSIYKNGELFSTFDTQVDMKHLFIGRDDKNYCWQDSRGALCFSDGTRFENASTPYHVTSSNKDEVIFLDIDIPTGNLYLCHHDL